jgi:two-component system chemotaxis sensor kinase CheA
VEDIRAQLLAAFEVEHRDHLEAIRRALEAPARADLREIFRRAHSLKGAARAVDLPRVEALAHELEAVLAEAMEGRLELAGDTLVRIRGLLDLIESEAAPHPGPPAAGEAGAEAGARGHELVRVDAEVIERLARASRELTGAVQAQSAVPDRLAALAEGVRRLAAGARGRRERTADRDLLHGLTALAQSLTALAAQQSRTEWSLQQAAARVREEVETIALAPAESVLGDLGRMVRGLAEDAGVAADVRVSGLGAHAERRVLQALRDPLIHLLRNAVSHGGETAAERRAAGKPEPLLIGLELSSAGGRLLVRVYDDGRGPQLERIAAAARERGVLPDDFRLAEASPEEVLALAFEPGVSSAEAVDQIAGRGMGLSIVAEAVRALGGSVTLAARRPHGAEVRLSAPISTARQLLVVVEASGDVFALPAFAVRRTLRIPAEEVEWVEDAPTVRIEMGESYVLAPMISLDRLLGRSPPPAAGGFTHALLLARGERRLALVVDAVRDVSELVLETLEPRGVDAALAVGAVRLEDDVPAAVLNPDALFDHWLRNQRRLAASGVGLATRAPAAAPRKRSILVVDDSITTRTLEKSILEAQGYRVLLAVDGVDALQTLRAGDAMVDLIVADVEMPRMDGFSLLQAIKADAALAQLPVILMTSRNDPQDIRRGMDLGADAYITKQKFDQRELLASIGRLL